MICWQGCVVLITLWLLILGIGIRRQWHLVRVRRLMSAGWTSEHRVRSCDANWQYISPDEGHHNRRPLRKAYQRYALLKQHKELNVPVPEPSGYELGGFKDEG